MTGKPLIENDRVEGTTVYDPGGNNVGSIKRRGLAVAANVGLFIGLRINVSKGSVP